MTDFLWRHFLMAFARPRESARAVIDRANGLEAVALLFGLGFCLVGVLQVVRWAWLGEQPVAGEGGLIGLMISQLMFSAFAFVVSTGLVFFIGRMFGGTGDFVAVGAAMAWHSLVTGVFTPFLTFPGAAPEGAEAAGTVSLGQVFILAFSTWILVNFITEAHGFNSVWRVAAVTFGLGIAASTAVLFLFAGAM